MDGILKILKKENGPRALSAPALELNTIIFKQVYWYMQQISGERLQDHWSSGVWNKNRQSSRCPKLLSVDCATGTIFILRHNVARAQTGL